MCNMGCFVKPVITGTIGILTKGLKNTEKKYKESIQWILYNKSQLYWEDGM
jgi:hypothetical protein